MMKDGKQILVFDRPVRSVDLPIANIQGRLQRLDLLKLDRRNLLIEHRSNEQGLAMVAEFYLQPPYPHRVTGALIRK
ncbi:hypothetical protein D3C71_1223690 [compost metagenome]